MCEAGGVADGANNLVLAAAGEDASDSPVEYFAAGKSAPNGGVKGPAGLVAGGGDEVVAGSQAGSGTVKTT